MFVVSGQVAVNWWSGTEQHIRTEMIAAGLAELTVTTRYARLDGHAVSYLQVLYFSTHLKRLHTR